ncbi:ORF-140 [Teiidae poxvirus 1]|nr:ORF-140 [Teiidae poxvirus 1]
MASQLYEAIHSEDLEEVLTIIRRNPGLLNREDEEHLFPLHCAVSRNNSSIVTAILDHGADINIFSDDTETALHKAVLFDSEEMVKLLISYGADIDSCDSPSSLTPLQYAIMYSNDKLTRILLEEGADPDCTCADNYPIIDAIRINDTDVVRLLLEYRVDLNIHDPENGLPIVMAIKYANIEIIELLLEHSTRMDLSDKELLHTAVSYHKPKVVQLLLDHKIDINAKDKNGNTALHLSIKHGCAELVKIFVDYGADLTILNNSSNTCFDEYEQLQRKNTQIQRMLVSRTLLMRHAKIVSVNPEGDRRNWKKIEADEGVKTYKIKCEKEIEVLKQMAIKSLTFLEICVKRLHCSSLLRLADINACKIQQLEIYKELVEETIKATKYREKLITESLNIMRTTSPQQTLWDDIPDEIKLLILNYLDNKDLIKIIGLDK